MSRWALIALAVLALGGVASSWLFPGDFSAIGTVGFCVTFVVIELGTMFAHPESETYGPLNPLSVSAERALAAALFLIGWIPSFLFPDTGPQWLDAAAYACGIPIGVAMFLFADSIRKRERRDRNQTRKFVA